LPGSESTWNLNPHATECVKQAMEMLMQTTLSATYMATDIYKQKQLLNHMPYI